MIHLSQKMVTDFTAACEDTVQVLQKHAAVAVVFLVLGFGLPLRTEVQFPVQQLYLRKSGKNPSPALKSSQQESQ